MSGKPGASLERTAMNGYDVVGQMLPDDRGLFQHAPGQIQIRLPITDPFADGGGGMAYQIYLHIIINPR